MEARNENVQSNYYDNEANTLGVFLVKRDATEEKLLFRYPYKIVLDHENDNVTASSANFNQKLTKTLNKYALIPKTEVTLTVPSSVAPLPAYTELATSYGVTSSDKEEITKVIGITDFAFANLFGAIKAKLCDKKFELKVDNVRFVGHPTRLENDHVFHVVFALKANASQDIVRGYHELSKIISTALRCEENRCGYFSEQSRIMISCHDEVNINDPTCPPEVLNTNSASQNPYELVLSRSELAGDIKKMFDQLRIDGIVHIRINHWISVDFCLPQKVHLNLLPGSGSGKQTPPITTANIHACLQRLRPYHTFLLLKDSSELLHDLPQDVSPLLVRLIRASNPLKNMLELASDADITLASTFQMVAELIYWGKATIIFPLCESNVYMLHPDARTDSRSELVDEFRNIFSGECLLKLLARISTGVSLSQLCNPMDTPAQQSRQVQIIIWMLRKRLLMQMHTYAQFVPLESGCTFLQKRFQKYDPSIQTGTFNDALDNVKTFGLCENISNDTFMRLEDVIRARNNASTTELGISPANKHFSELSMTIDSGPSTATANNLHNASNREAAELILRDIGLQTNEIESVMSVSASRCLDDLRLFANLCKYFDGLHHIEDIMYYENLRRHQILTIIDKFRDVLIFWQYEDTTVVKLQPYDVLDIH